MSTSTFRTITAVVAIVPGTGLPFGVYRFPTAEPDDSLDYSLQFAALLADVGDSLASVSVSVQPWGTGELAASDFTVSGSGTLATVWLSGGVAGRSYLVKWDITGVSGRVWEVLTYLPIDATLAANPIPAPPNAGFGAPLYWPQQWFTVNGAFLQVATDPGYPTATTWPGAVYRNGNFLCVTLGQTPNPDAAPLYLATTSGTELLIYGGGNLPVSAGPAGSQQLWLNGDFICVS